MVLWDQYDLFQSFPGIQPHSLRRLFIDLHSIVAVQSGPSGVCLPAQPVKNSGVDSAEVPLIPFAQNPGGLTAQPCKIGLHC
ncbi:hypothetical protein D3C75_952970 [compost metagenome]